MTQQQQYPAPLPPSFTGKAVAALVLTVLLWLPGVIANILFLKEAQAAQRHYGQSLPGVGCLWTMLLIQAAAFLLIIFLIASLASS